jgi:hypothetical protein
MGEICTGPESAAIQRDRVRPRATAEGEIVVAVGTQRDVEVQVIVTRRGADREVGLDALDVEVAPLRRAGGGETKCRDAAPEDLADLARRRSDRAQRRRDQG